MHTTIANELRLMVLLDDVSNQLGLVVPLVALTDQLGLAVLLEDVSNELGLGISLTALVVSTRCYDIGQDLRLRSKDDIFGSNPPPPRIRGRKISSKTRK